METKPEKPAPSSCACGAVLSAEYIDPVFYSIGKLGPQKKFSGTGIWRVQETCSECLRKAQEASDAAEVRRQERAKKENIQYLLTTSGFMPKEFDMIGKPWEGSQARRDSMAMWWKGEGKSLYIHGTPGTGKTHAAAAALRDFIVNTQRPGKFFVVADLIRKLRIAVKTHDDDRMVEEVANAPALVLDDIAVERPTGFVLEAMQSIIDIRYRNMDALTIITSNLSLDQLAARLDDRIASRLVSMCEIVEFAGADRRLR